MDGINVVHPQLPTFGSGPASDTSSASSGYALACAKMEAAMAAEDLQVLEQAADAAKRAGGSWSPAGALNFRDFQVLGQAQDITRDSKGGPH